MPNTPTTSPSDTSTVTPETAVTFAFRDFADGLAGPLNGMDSSFFKERMQTKHVVCTQEEVERLGPGFGCDRAGQEFEGVYLSYWRSDVGSWVQVDTAISRIESLWSEAVPGAADQFGDSSPRVYAIGGPVFGPVGPDIPVPATPTAYLAVITAIHEIPIGNFQTGPRRVALITNWQVIDGQWRLVSLMDALRGGGDFIEPTQEGRDYIPNWERIQS